MRKIRISKQAHTRRKTGNIKYRAFGKYEELLPSQIVPKLADEGKYIASESSYYRVLREANEMKPRGLSKLPVKGSISTYTVTAPNQVWMWAITYLNGPIKGTHYYLYLISDLFSRKIVGWEVWKKKVLNMPAN